MERKEPRKNHPAVTMLQMALAGHIVRVGGDDWVYQDGVFGVVRDSGGFLDEDFIAVQNGGIRGERMPKPTSHCRRWRCRQKTCLCACAACHKIKKNLAAIEAGFKKANEEADRILPPKES